MTIANGLNTITITVTDPAGNQNTATLKLRRGKGKLSVSLLGSQTQFKASKLPTKVTFTATVTGSDGRRLPGASALFTVSIPGLQADRLGRDHDQRRWRRDLQDHDPGRRDGRERPRDGARHGAQRGQRRPPGHPWRSTRPVDQAFDESAESLDRRPGRSYDPPMPVWRCPHCATPQTESSRCWVCRRSTTSCATCRHFRRGVAGGLGTCGLAPRRWALDGTEMRACWTGIPQGPGASGGRWTTVPPDREVCGGRQPGGPLAGRPRHRRPSTGHSRAAPQNVRSRR